MSTTSTQWHKEWSRGSTSGLVLESEDMAEGTFRSPLLLLGWRESPGRAGQVWGNSAGRFGQILPQVSPETVVSTRKTCWHAESPKWRHEPPREQSAGSLQTWAPAAAG